MFTLTIDTDNAAFENDPQHYEISQCMRSVTEALMRGETTGKVLDSNGNTVGEWKIGEVEKPLEEGDPCPECSEAMWWDAAERLVYCPNDWKHG